MNDPVPTHPLVAQLQAHNSPRPVLAHPLASCPEATSGSKVALIDRPSGSIRADW
jgi:hypothetical protein